MATFSFEEAAGLPKDVSVERPEPVAKKTFTFEEAFDTSRRPEDVSFTEGAGAALKRGVESYGDVGAGLGLAGLSVTGQKEAAAKKMQEIKAEAKAPQATPGMAWADFERIASEKGVTEALKEAPKYIVEQVLANAPQMAAPLAVGAGVGAVSGPAGVITGPLAGIATYGIQQFGNFLVRQAQEKKDPEELEVAKAALTAAGTAPLGYFVDRFTAGIGGKSVAAVGKEAMAELAKRGVGAATGAVAKKVGKGAAEGVIAEAPTEWLEQVAERYQAGLPLTGEEAKKEYKEAIAGAAAVGGAAKGTSTAIQASREAAKTFSFEEAQEKPAMTKGERKDMEQAEDRARAAAPVETAPVSQAPVSPAPVTGKEPWEEIADEILKKKPIEPVAPIEETKIERPPEPMAAPIEIPSKKGKIEGVDEININPNELKLSEDVPQFKEDANEKGIVEPLQGEKYDYVGTPPIQVWRRLDGSLEIISGRHRWDLAKRTGAEYIPAQVFDEAKGFNADMAAIMDAELNIRDGKGKVTDYVNYFREAGNRFGLTEKDYRARGLLDSEKGRKAYSVTVQGSDELIQALRGRQVKEDTAYRIAEAVPNDPRLQALGLKLVNEKPLEQAINILHAAKTIEPKAPEMGGDLFGFDDSGLKLAEDMGKLAAQKQKELSDQITAIQGAGRKSDIAKKYGVNVEDPAAVNAKVKELKAERAAWDNWASNPELVDQIRREIAGEPAPVEAAPPVEPVAKKAKKKPAETTEKITAENVAVTAAKIARREDKRSIDPRTDQILVQEIYLQDIARSDAKKASAIAKELRKNAEKYSEAANVSPEKIGAYASIIELQLKLEESKAKTAEIKVKPEAKAEETIEEQYKKAFDEMAKIKTRLMEARKAGEDTRELERQDEAIMEKLAEITPKYDAWAKAKREAKAEGDKVKSVKQRRDPMGTDYLVTLNDGRTAVIYRSEPGGDFGLGAWYLDKAGYDLPAVFQGGDHRLGFNKKEALENVAKKLDELEKYRRKPKEKTAETLPSFELEPEAKVTTAEKKAAAERETKEIADREREFFTLQPRTPEQGAGNYLQQDMIGAMGLTEAEYKKGIDKNSTDPGEPLILRDVTALEEDAYNDDANKKVDEAINEELAAVPNLNNINVDKANVGDTFERMSKAIEDYITLSSQDKVTAEEFLASAKEAAAKGDIEPDVYDAIQKIYKLYPKILEGIRIEAISGGKKSGRYREAGHYQPLARMIRLFKDTSGVADPATVRHELAHTMEQMMSPDQKRMIVRAWRDEIIRASKAEETDAGREFFVNIAEYMRKPSFGSLKALVKSMPNESYYQYINPSEYWAVNAEKILKSRSEGAAGIKAYLTKVHEGMKQAFGNSNFWVGNKVFDQILTGDKISNRMVLSYVRKTKLRNYKGNEAPSSTWDIGSSSWVEDATYHMQDKYIDLKNVQKEIERMSGTLSDEKNPYVKETLTHSRISSRMAEFDRDFVQPLVKTMEENNVSQMQLHEYLLARHAPERNKRMGDINPDVGDMGSSITTKEAEDYMRSLSPARKAQLEKAADKADKMLERTREVLVEGGVEDPKIIKGWKDTYEFYVPLFRKDIEYPKHMGSNRPSSKARGKFSRTAVGSTKEVDDIGKNIILEHFRAIDKVENARVKNALVSLAISNPQTDFWMVIKPGAKENVQKIREQLYKMGNDSKVIDNLMQTPKRGVTNLETGLVEYVADSNFLNSPNVVATRFQGEDYYVVFNNNNPRAKRMGVAINNVDAENLTKAMKVSAYISRYFASINTQYNIGFGPINFIRDTFGAGLNLSTTKLKGQSKAVMIDAIKNMPEIYRILRHERKEGTAATGGQAEKWYQYNKTGGATGSRARWVDPSSKEKDLLEKAIKSYNAGDAKKIADVMTGWVSDYNDMFENAVRFAAFKKALAMGLSEDEAANIAKNITVNFNRKGASTQNLGALYAFFNASVQGTARTWETMKGPNGVKIAAGGIMLGVAQAMWLAAAGYRDDEPAEFVKEKNFVFLLPGGRYISIPMPLGFNVLPNLGRIMTEAAIGALNGRDVSGKFQDALSSLFNAFNPLGSSGLSLQTIMPTPIDPIVALGQNKDAFGKPIYKEDRATSPTVGYERTRDTTSEVWKNIAKFINYASFGTEDEKGAFSPTGDEVAFMVGQLTGGTGREIQKIYGVAEDFVQGKDTPSHKLPFVSRLYGNVESEAATKTRFYNNVTELAKMESVIDGKIKRKENVGEYYRSHPAARLTNMANNIENQITQLNKSRKIMIERGATMEQLKRIEDAKVKLMKSLNERYDKMR